MRPSLALALQVMASVSRSGGPMASPCARGNDHTGDSDWPQDEDHGPAS